jgi:hypothetical protein
MFQAETACCSFSAELSSPQGAVHKSKRREDVAFHFTFLKYSQYVYTTDFRRSSSENSKEGEPG